MVNGHSSAVVSTDTGDLQGIAQADRGRAFLGIPYASPPVGPLRWRAPQRVEPWAGVRSAQSFGPSSLQGPPPENSLYFGGEREFSEDCLYLNVWTGRDGDRHRPVMVWLHFGAYQFGSASNPSYDGSALAAAGVTVVSVNYRLGRFGFLAHPDLTAESTYGGSGNYGLMDQIAALQWVQRNIEAFGGDPDNVTLFGVSAGGNSVHNLRSTPLAEGLFHKVIAQSAPGVAPALDGFGHPAHPSTLAAGERAGIELAELLEVSSIEEMRRLPSNMIMQAQLPRTSGPWSFDLFPGAAISLHVFDSAYPVIDGHVLPRTPLEAYRSGTAIDVPMIAGNAGNESAGLPYIATLAPYRDHVACSFGAFADEVLTLYPATSDVEAKKASWDLLADQIFVWSTWTAARLQCRTLQSPAWYYRFLRTPPIPAEADVVERDYAGAFHGAEVPYVFGNLGMRPWDWTDADRELSERIMHSWVAFARTGNPNVSSNPEWPAFRPGLEPVRVWDLDSGIASQAPRPEQMEFWDRYHGLGTALS